tara:strand:- start:3311 stop:3679 length:369 start_codon:yes stop_codon:yes gene_type:complete
MSDLEHRVGVNEVNLVVRNLKLVGVNETNRDAIVEAIDHTYGIDSVQYDDKTATLHLAYDATHCQLDGLEEMLLQHGADISHDWWTHFKEGNYQFVDENVRENAKHKPWSCHTLPPGNGRKR